MRGPRRRRHAAAVGALALTLASAVALLGLGGARTDQQTRLPSSTPTVRLADRTTTDRGVVARAAVAADVLPPLVATLPGGAGAGVALVVLFVLATVVAPVGPARLVPAVATRGPPLRTRR